MSQIRRFGIVSWGHAAFALTMATMGILGLVQGDFTPEWSGVPRTFPARAALPYVVGIISLASGLGFLWRRTAIVAARLLLGALVAWLVLFRLPVLARNLTNSGAWWIMGNISVMIGSAMVPFAWFAGDWDRTRLGFATGDRGLRIARILYGLGLIPFGVAHFTFWERTVTMVPAWLPFHPAWAVLTGSAFIAAGAAMALGVQARLAATLSTLMMGLFTLIVWVPVIMKHPMAGDWAEFVSSWTLTAAGWIVADSYRASPNS